MRKVLSPISENIIIAEDCSTACGVLSPLPRRSLVGAMAAEIRTVRLEQTKVLNDLEVVTSPLRNINK